jgi:hypothetical protein
MVIIILASCFFTNQDPPTPSPSQLKIELRRFEIEIRWTFISGNLQLVQAMEKDIANLQDRAKRFPARTESYKAQIDKVFAIKEKLLSRTRDHVIALFNTLLAQIGDWNYWF